MMGMLYVFSIPTLIFLKQTGTSYSFISDSFRRRLGFKYYDGIEELEVCIPSGEIIKTKNMVKGVKLTVRSQEIKDDL